MSENCEVKNAEKDWGEVKKMLEKKAPKFEQKIKEEVNPDFKSENQSQD